MPVHHPDDTEAAGEMTQKSKQVATFRDAVQDMPDGATVAFGGFAMPGVPFN